MQEASSAAEAARQLAAAFRCGAIDLAIPAIAASERQRGGGYLGHFDRFVERLETLGLGDVSLIPAIAYWDIGFYGHAYWADDSMVDLERRIHSILHPGVEFDLRDCCLARGLAVDTAAQPAKWRNAKCQLHARTGIA